MASLIHQHPTAHHSLWPTPSCLWTPRSPFSIGSFLLKELTAGAPSQSKALLFSPCICLSKGRYCCDETPWPKQHGKERVHSAHTATLLIIKWSQDRNSNRVWAWNQDLIQRPWKGSAAYWLTTHGLLSLLSCRAQDQVWLYSQWLWFSTINYLQRKCITTWSYGHTFSFEIPSFQLTLAYVKFT